MQFTDTIDLFNYGFSNFQAVNASESDTTYNIQGNGFFMTENDIFGDSEPILSLDKSSYVVLPSDASFEDVTSELDYENVSDGQAALIRYSWHDQPVGTAAVLFSDHISSYDFNEDPAAGEASDAGEADLTALAEGDTGESQSAAAPSQSGAAGQTESENVVFVNIRNGALIVLGVVALVILILISCSAFRNHARSKRRQAIMKHRREHRDEIIDFDRYIDPF